MHARTGHSLIAVHQVFTLAEAVKEHRHRTNIETMRAEPHQVIQDAGHFIEHDTNILCARRRRNAEQLFDGQHIAMLVAHHRYVVEAIHVTDALVKGLRLRKLLRAPMQQADVRVRLLNNLSVHFENQAQHAMRRRVLRPEVHREILNLSHR